MSVRRKDVLGPGKGIVWEEESTGPSLVDYASMTRDELVDHFIDDGGLAQFIDTQMAGVPRSEWDWRVITRDLMAFSHYLQFSPGYCEELYAMQKERTEQQGEA